MPLNFMRINESSSAPSAVETDKPSIPTSSGSGHMPADRSGEQATQIEWDKDGMPQKIKVLNGDEVSFSKSKKDTTHIEVTRANAPIPGYNKISFDFTEGTLASGVLKTFGSGGTGVTAGKYVMIYFPTGQVVNTGKTGGAHAYYDNFKTAIAQEVSDIGQAVEIASKQRPFKFNYGGFKHELHY